MISIRTTVLVLVSGSLAACAQIRETDHAATRLDTKGYDLVKAAPTHQAAAPVMGLTEIKQEAESSANAQTLPQTSWQFEAEAEETEAVFSARSTISLL